MARWLLSLALLVLVIGGLMYFLAAYQVVRTERGYAIWEKKDWEFTVPVLDMRNIADSIRDSRISKALSKLDLDKIKTFAQKSWREVSKQWEEIDLDQASGQARATIKNLKQEAQKRYDNLVEKWEKGEINTQELQERLEELHAWTKKKVLELKAKIG